MKSLFLLPAVLRFVVAESHAYPFYQSSDFSSGKLGPYPNRTFNSRPDLTAPALNYISSSSACDDGLYTILSLRGDAVESDGEIEGRAPMILDGKGELVWMDPKYGETYDLAVQIFEGREYLTFWQGKGRKEGHSTGVYVMLDCQYKEFYRSDETIAGDLHEFHLTDQGTALSTQYQLKTITIPHRRHPLPIWDSVFQEFDLHTNTILFTWSASDHFDVADSYSGGANVGEAFDFFHINSVDKDAAGNYLISSRYYSSLVYVDGTTGAVRWELGGKRNAFRDLSNGQATNFAFQHHARWNSDHTGITLFDNGARYGIKPVRKHSRGLSLSLDMESMTVQLEREYVNEGIAASASQGSMEVLPGGNVLLGYGYNAAWTEFSAQGEVLCDVHFGAASGFGTGAVQAYRVRKAAWKGEPVDPPVLQLKGEKIFVSWNGATEVKAWAVEESLTREGSFERKGTMNRSGFETSIDVRDVVGCWIRAVAISKDGTVIGTSNTADACTVRLSTPPVYPKPSADNNQIPPNSELPLDEAAEQAQLFENDLLLSNSPIIWFLTASAISIALCAITLRFRYSDLRRYEIVRQEAEDLGEDGGARVAV